MMRKAGGREAGGVGEQRGALPPRLDGEGGTRVHLFAELLKY